MGSCIDSSYLDKQLAEARADAEAAKKLARELGIGPKISKILACKNKVVSGDNGLTLAKSYGGGLVARMNGNLVFSSSYSGGFVYAFHYGAWVNQLDGLVREAEKEVAANKAEAARKGYELRRLKRSFSV